MGESKQRKLTKSEEKELMTKIINHVIIKKKRLEDSKNYIG